MAKRTFPRVVILTGGVGGSKLVEGFAARCSSRSLAVIGNTGDDVELHGLWISPDVDILTYTLAGVVNRKMGWGIAGDTFHTLAAWKRLGKEAWFNLGDRDLTTHILRTQLRRKGVRPTEIARRIAKQLGVTLRILLPTDDPVQTRILTRQGWLNFQEYFVREKCRLAVRDVQYHGARSARPTPEVLAALAKSSLIVFAPSNPLASIGPILAVPGIRQAIRRSSAMKIAVCPIVGGRSLKGPSDRMLRAMGFSVNPSGVAECYRGLIDGMVIDRLDKRFEKILRSRGLKVRVANTIMKNRRDKKILAQAVLDLACPS